MRKQINIKSAAEKMATSDFIQRAAIVIVAVGCYTVLSPFIPAVLFAAVTASVSWPVFTRIKQKIGGRASPAALIMTILLVSLVVVPLSLLAISVAQSMGVLVDALQALVTRGPIKPPGWLNTVPIIGEPLTRYWQRLVVNQDELSTLLKNLYEPAKNIVLASSKAVGTSFLQMTFATFICFFFYRDGPIILQSLRSVMHKLADDQGDELLDTIDKTLTGVVHGIFGTALAQAAVAYIGLLIAGVPAALALSAGTFFLSLVPIGPPLIWCSAAIWLFYQGAIGWSIFLVLWGLLAISSIDNFLKPYLISRTSNLPMLLIVLGVFGGIVSFGFVGIFIGPPILAIGLTLVRYWAPNRST